MTRYIIIGTGAVGGTLAARLTAHHVDVVAVARGENGDAIESDGLMLASPDDRITVHPTRASGPADVSLQADDVLVLTVKTHQAGRALADWADRDVQGPSGQRLGSAGEVLPVVTALNGVHSEALAARYFRTVVAACVLLPAVHLRPGEVLVRVGPISGGFILGNPNPRTADSADSAIDPADSPVDETIDATIDAVTRDWTPASFEVRAKDNVMDFKHNKLLSNLANAAQALLGPGADGLEDIVTTLQAEGATVLDAAGIGRVGESEREKMRTFISQVRPVAGQPDDVGGSTWQSLMRGTGLESDYLNGEIVAIAHRAGLTAPANGAVARLARRAAADGNGPGDITAADIAAEIEAAERAVAAGTDGA